MATLETLRTKAGVFISVVIGIALLGFMIDADTIQSARALFSSDNTVGIIAGKEITHEEYGNLLDYNTTMYKLPYALMGNTEAPSGDEVNERIQNSTWQDLIRRYTFEKEYKKIGISLSDAELYDLTLGSNPSPIISNFFGNADRANLVNFVQNMDGDYKVFWIYLEQQIRDQQLMMRYTLLEQKSHYVNSLDIEAALDGEKQNVEFSYLLKDYTSVADSLITYKETDLKNYYDKNRAKFKERRSRDAEFVAFTVKPSATDYEKVMAKMEQLQKQMDTIPSKDFSMFVGMHSDEPFVNVYKKKGDLPAVLDTVIFSKKAGYVHPYYQDGDAYLLSGVVEFKNLPDSVKAQHILFGQNNFDKVDSVYNLLKAGANFNELAAQFSTDGSAQTGGDLGWFTFEQMVRPFSDSCFYKPVGSIMKVITQYGIHIVKVTGAKEYKDKALIATVKKNVMPTKETYKKYYAQANSIAAQSEGNLKKFREICAAENLQPTIEPNIALESKNVGQFRNASALVRWLYEAKEGEVSGIIEIDNKKTYVVAALTGMRDAGILPYHKAKRQILSSIINEKKAEYLIEEINKAKGGTLDETGTKLGLGAIAVTPAVNFNTSYIPTLRMPEYKLLGAVTSSPANHLSEPIVGESGVYLFTVTSIVENPQAQTAEAIKSRLENSYSNSYTTLIESAKIVDNRGKYY
ncbi:MAG: peptidylprolyl isomerase [Prevotellaceae bacterium]|jgi:peptidyl-prolyl cis-trans isomerase D|nr:peptidylprolyl isomerase [Prevotellaceae bacterium]